MLLHWTYPNSLSTYLRYYTFSHHAGSYSDYVIHFPKRNLFTPNYLLSFRQLEHLVMRVLGLGH
jgi:hypothetical protein